MINGETAAYTAPAFRKGMVRTTEDMLRRLYKNFVDEVSQRRSLNAACTRTLMTADIHDAGPHRLTPSSQDRRTTS